MSHALRTVRPMKRGFTLIELLVVIAIIAILASILFPVFGRARENARRTSCSSNMKQIALGMLQYSQDYDERFPGAFGTAVNTEGDVNNQMWDAAIMPYMGLKVKYDGSPLVFQCPSDTRARNWGTIRSYSMPFNENPRGWVDGNGTDSTDLQMMGGVFRSWPGWHMVGRNQSEVPVPAETLLLVENPQNENIFANWAGAVAGGVPWQKTWDWSDLDNLPQPTHFDGYNYAFTDGHVKWLRPEKTIGTGNIWWEPKGMWTIQEGD